HGVRRDQGRHRQGATRQAHRTARQDPARRGGDRYQGERTAKNYDFVDAVARKNVELTIADIRRRSAVLAELVTAKAVKIAGATSKGGWSNSSVDQRIW